MSLKDRPRRHFDSDSAVVSGLLRVAEALRTHTATWARRYVEQRVEARVGGK